jgi:hypothetical protein
MLRRFSEVCHCYFGKTGHWQVVLKTAAKRLQLNGRKSQYLSLLVTVLKRLQTQTIISDLFVDLQNGGLHNAILASNFTILKKFLNKYNSCFRWFQEKNSKTQKITKTQKQSQKSFFGIPKQVRQDAPSNLD